MFGKFFHSDSIQALEKIVGVHTFLGKRKVIGTALVASLSKNHLNNLREINFDKDSTRIYYDHFLQTFLRSYAASIIHIVINKVNT